MTASPDAPFTGPADAPLTVPADAPSTGPATGPTPPGRPWLVDPVAVPAVAPARLPRTCLQREATLVWAVAGTAVVTAGGRHVTLDAGRALWIPPGVPYTGRTGPGSVAVPIVLAADARATLPAAASGTTTATSAATSTHGAGSPAATTPERPLDFDVPPRWHAWLLHLFARSLGYLRGATGSAPDVLDLVGRAAPHPAGGGSAAAPIRAVAFPPLPHAPEAAEVASTLLRAPADPRDTAQWARDLHLGVRTLQEQFVRDTGLTFGRWRTRVRVAAAAAHLLDGRPVGWVAAQVGFETTAGLTRAFRARTGQSPRAFAAAHAAHADHAVRAAVRALPRGTPETGETTERFAPPTPPTVPAGRTWERINDFDVVVWLERGRARVRVGADEHELRGGDALWLPAGVPNRIETAPGSVLLPLGSRPAVPGAAPAPRVLRAPAPARTFLLHTLVAGYTHWRPADHDPGLIGRFALDALRPAPSAPDPVRTLLAAVRADPADTRTLAAWARTLRTDPDRLARDIRAATGGTLERCRARARMTLARRLLEEDLPVGAVAARLGYAHAPAFSARFTADHGMTPSAYRAAARRTALGTLDP